MLVKEPKHLTFSWSGGCSPTTQPGNLLGPFQIFHGVREVGGERRRALSAKTATTSRKSRSCGWTLYCAGQPGLRVPPTAEWKPKRSAAKSCSLRRRRRSSLPVRSAAVGIYHCASRRRAGAGLNTKEWRGDKDTLACSARTQICLIAITNYSSYLIAMLEVSRRLY